MELKKIAIIGAGTMGASIAQWFSQQLVTVHLSDQNTSALKNAETSINNSFEKLVSKNKFSASDATEYKHHLKYISLDDLEKDYDLVIEAIIEDESIKKELFKKLDGLCEDKTILATNTSSISISRLASAVDENRRSRFCGLHFFNPATIMKLVEIIGHSSADSSLLDELFQWFSAKGKQPAICQDSPGFIVNRVARNFYGEALRIAGVGGKEEQFKEIDQIMREVGGFRMGPFELLDLIGVDVNLAVTKSVWKDFYHEPRFAPHRLQQSLVDSGKYGKKSGKGFYQYDS